MHVSVHGGSFSIELIEERPGIKVFRVIGKDATRLFKNEAGGHRWQRIPPTEKRGRVHTSTITVAVLPEPLETEVNLPEKDLEWTYCRGSGKGGQHRNVTDSAVQLTHKPSKLMVRCESERSQIQNKRTALALLRARLWEIRDTQINGDRSQSRKDQVGSGMRGDKRRTIRTQDCMVKDHITGKHWNYDQYVNGQFDNSD